MKTQEEKQLNKFITLLTKLEPTEFIGMARLFNLEVYKRKERPEAKTENNSQLPLEIDFKDKDNAIKYINENFEPKSAEELVFEMSEKFLALNRDRRRNLLREFREVREGK